MIDNNGKLYLLHNIFCSEHYTGEDLLHKVMNYQQKWREEELNNRMFLNEFIVNI